MKLTGFDDVDESQLLYQYGFVNGALRVVLRADSTPMIKILRERNNKCSALITYKEKEDAEAAIRLYDARDYYGNTISLKLHDRVSPAGGDRVQSEPEKQGQADTVDQADAKPPKQVCFYITLKTSI